jgi:hypothetical protein
MDGFVIILPFHVLSEYFVGGIMNLFLHAMKILVCFFGNVFNRLWKLKEISAFGVFNC